MQSFTAPTGPFGIIFAAFVFFWLDIPQLSSSRVLGGLLSLSEKSITYFMGVQLVIYRGFPTAITALCGALAGVLFRSKSLPFRRIRFPAKLVNIASLLFGASSPRQTGAAVTARAAGVGGAGGVGAAVGAEAQAWADADPLAAAIAASLADHHQHQQNNNNRRAGQAQAPQRDQGTAPAPAAATAGAGDGTGAAPASATGAASASDGDSRR